MGVLPSMRTLAKSIPLLLLIGCADHTPALAVDVLGVVGDCDTPPAFAGADDTADGLDGTSDGAWLVYTENGQSEWMYTQETAFRRHFVGAFVGDWIAYPDDFFLEPDGSYVGAVTFGKNILTCRMTIRIQ